MFWIQNIHIKLYSWLLLDKNNRSEKYEHIILGKFGQFRYKISELNRVFWLFQLKVRLTWDHETPLDFCKI